MPEQPEKSMIGRILQDIRPSVQHHLEHGVFSSLLSDFIRYINKVVINSDNKMAVNSKSSILKRKRATTKRPIRKTRFQYIALRILNFLAFLSIIVARAIDTPLFFITAPLAVVLTKESRKEVAKNCFTNLYEGFKSILVIAKDASKAKDASNTIPNWVKPYYPVKSKTKVEFDPDIVQSKPQYSAKEYVMRKRLSQHERMMLYRERPDLNLSGYSDQRKPHMRLEELSRYLFNDSIPKQVEKDFLTGKKLKNGVTANKLKKEGISAADLLMLGVLPKSLLEAGFTQEQLDEKGRISVVHLLDIGVSTESLKNTGVSNEQLHLAQFLRNTRQTRYDIFENIRYSDAVETKLMNELKGGIVVKDNEIEYEIRVDGDSLKLIQSPPLHNKLLVYNFDLNSKRVVRRWVPEGKFKRGTLGNRFESMKEFTQYVEFTHEKAIIESLLDKFSVFSNTVDQPDNFTDGQKQFLRSIFLTPATKNTVINEILSKGFVEGEDKSFDFSILFEDIKCGIRYRDQSLELIQFQDNDNHLVHTATNFDDVRSREVTTEEFKKNDTGEVLKFSSIDEFKTFVNPDSSEFSQKLDQASIVPAEYTANAHTAHALAEEQQKPNDKQYDLELQGKDPDLDELSKCLSAVNSLDKYISTEPLKKYDSSVEQSRAKSLTETRQTRQDIFQQLDSNPEVMKNLLNGYTIKVSHNNILCEISVDGDSLQLIQYPAVDDALLVYESNRKSKEVVKKWDPKDQFKNNYSSRYKFFSSIEKISELPKESSHQRLRRNVGTAHLSAGMKRKRKERARNEQQPENETGSTLSEKQRLKPKRISRSI